MSYFQYVADFQKFCSEERILQLKMVMNQIFSRQKVSFSFSFSLGNSQKRC